MDEIVELSMGMMDWWLVAVIFIAMCMAIASNRLRFKK